MGLFPFGNLLLVLTMSEESILHCTHINSPKSALHRGHLTWATGWTFRDVLIIPVSVWPGLGLACP